jgi:hypothetical protein
MACPGHNSRSYATPGLIALACCWRGSANTSVGELIFDLGFCPLGTLGQDFADALVTEGHHHQTGFQIETTASFSFTTGWIAEFHAAYLSSLPLYPPITTTDEVT